MYKKQEMEESNSDVLGGGHGMKLQSFLFVPENMIETIYACTYMVCHLAF